MVSNLSHVFLSNRMEQLYEELKVQLFAGKHPFSRRLILIPSSAMKMWLRLRMAEDPEMGIATGVEMGYVESTLNQLYQQFFETSSSLVNEPSELEVALGIEAVILRKLTEFSNKEWAPLSDYLGISLPLQGAVSRKIVNRINGLSSALAKLFRHYGLYGQQLLEHWKEETSTIPHWQSLVWHELESLFSIWQYPIQKFSSFNLKDKCVSQELHIHLFGFNFLAPIYHRLLQKLASLMPIHYYLLSPCHKFWGDALSDKEQIKLRSFWTKKGATQASLESLEQLLRERNPILANFGRLGREMAQTIESLDALSTEKYGLPLSVLSIPTYEDSLSQDLQFEDTKGPLTLLQALQADVALLRSPEHQEKLSFQDYDETIQIHAAPKISREVQVIYDLLLGIIDKHRDHVEPILPSDILVMAPNICEYAPFIRSVFESNESQLEIQLMDLEAPAQSLIVQGFLQLLSLSHGRWEASAFLQLLDYPAFLLRHQLSQDDVLTIRKWVKEAGIFWGNDSAHRSQFYTRKYCTSDEVEESDIGTWQYGLGKMLERLAFAETSLDEDHEGQVKIEASQSDLLGTVLRLVRSLQTDLQPLINGTQWTLQHWTTYLHCLFDAYFLPGSQDVHEIEGTQFLRGCIEEFSKAFTRLQEAHYSFETIYRHFKTLLQKEMTTHRETNVHSIRFSSLRPMRAVPAKVIVLMGMGDGLFPRIEQNNTLNLLLSNPHGDYYPSQVDLDRYIFLEAILSARNYFVLSYVSQKPGDARVLSPSLLGKELLGYLDQSYRIEKANILELPSKFCVYQHPLVPFHRAYFSEESRLKSYSVFHYKAACEQNHQKKKTPHTFLSGFSPPESKKIRKEIDLTFDIKNLFNFAKNPLKTYFNQSLGIYIDKESDKKIQDETDLFLSDLNAAILIKKGMFTSEKEMLMRAESSGKLPQGPFKTLGVEKIKREIERITENVKGCGIDLKEVFAIEMREYYGNSSFEKGVWRVPPFICEIPEIGPCRLIGRLDDISLQGKLVFSQEDNKKLFSLWPEWLLLRCLIAREKWAILPHLLFVKGKKAKVMEPKESDKPPEEIFKSYLKYFVEYQSEPSPLVPDWISSIVSSKEEEINSILKENANEDFALQFDQYITWMGRNSPHIDLAASLSYWQTKGQHLFEGLLEIKSKRATTKEEV